MRRGNADADVRRFFWWTDRWAFPGCLAGKDGKHLFVGQFSDADIPEKDISPRIVSLEDDGAWFQA